MSNTLSELRNRVIIDKLDDDSFDTAIVDRFINDTQRDIFNTYELPFMETNFVGILPAAQRTFRFPDNCQLVQSASITDPEGKEQNIMHSYMDFRTFTHRYPTPANNTPSAINAWTSHGGKLYASAPIDQQYSLEIFYIKKPTPLTAAEDVAEIPEEFQEILVLGAFKRVLERNEDYDLAGVIGNQYNDQLDKMVARYGFRLSNGPIVMKQPRRSPTRRR